MPTKKEFKFARRELKSRIAKAAQEVDLWADEALRLNQELDQKWSQERQNKYGIYSLPGQLDITLIYQ